ncbi:MAG: hypothetical protein WCK78_16525 [Paludibacter sp.]
MEIVPTSAPKKRKLGFDDLIVYKAELKSQISNQKHQISVSGQKMFSLESIAGYVLGTIQRNMTIADGVMMGMKVVQTVKKLFTKKK